MKKNKCKDIDNNLRPLTMQVKAETEIFFCIRVLIYNYKMPQALFHILILTRTFEQKHKGIFLRYVYFGNLVELLEVNLTKLCPPHLKKKWDFQLSELPTPHFQPAISYSCGFHTPVLVPTVAPPKCLLQGRFRSIWRSDITKMLTEVISNYMPLTRRPTSNYA